MKSVKDLEILRSKSYAGVKLRENIKYDHYVIVPMSTCGISNGARNTMLKMIDEIEKLELNVLVSQCECINLCNYEPIVKVIDNDGIETIYIKVDEIKAVEIVHDHLLNKKIIKQYTLNRD